MNDMRFSASDRLHLKSLGVAIDEKEAHYERWLAEQNLALAHAVQKWIEQAREANRRLRRTHRALLFVSAIAGIGWCGFWFMVGWRVFQAR